MNLCKYLYSINEAFRITFLDWAHELFRLIILLSYYIKDNLVKDIMFLSIFIIIIGSVNLILYYFNLEGVTRAYMENNKVDDIDRI